MQDIDKIIKHIVILVSILSFSIHSNGQVIPEWADTIGGNNPIYNFVSIDMRVDGIGNTYTVGSKCDGQVCSMIFAKYSPSGVRLFLLDTLPNHSVKAMSMDDSSNIYIALNILPGNVLLILKYNSFGNLVWSSTSAGSSGMRFLGTIKMINDSYGNVYIAGEGDTITNLPHFNIVTMKFDPYGAFLWARKYFRGDGNVFLGLDSNQNVYVTGRGVDSTNSSWDIVLLKYDTNGILQWNRNFSNLNDNEDPAGMEVSPTGNCYIFGQNRPLSGTTWPKYLILRYDSNGNLIWFSIPSNGPGWDRARDIKIDADENIYVTGTQNAENSNYYNYLTIKYDSSGNIGWINVYDNLIGVASESAFTLCIDDNSNVYVIGFSGSLNTNYSGLLTVKYNSNGDSIWSTVYNSIPSNYYNFRCVCDAGNNVYLSGNGFPNILTLKYGSTVGIPEINSTLNSIIIYPNPADQTLNIDLNSSNDFEIYNILGEIIKSEIISISQKNKIIIDISHFPTGLYFIKVGLKVEKFIKK